MSEGRPPTDAAETVAPSDDTKLAADVIADLRAAADRVADAEAAIDEAGDGAVEAAADAHRQATRLLDAYADSATGTGDFKAYLQFQGQFLDLVDGLPDDIVGADGFERASDRLDKRRLSEADFAFAREAIEPAGEAVAMLEEREAAHEASRAARHAAKRRLAALREEAAELRAIQRLGEADLTTSLDPLAAPIEAYNDAVRAAFDRFRTDRSARELFSLLEAGADRPLVDVDRPPRDLADYVETTPAGTEPLSTLETYAEYSPSKLDHYVEDPGALRTHVAVHQTYLDRLGPEPFLVAWPPAPAATLRARLDELAPLCRRLDTAFEDALDVEAATDDSTALADVPSDVLAVDSTLVDRQNESGETEPTAVSPGEPADAPPSESATVVSDESAAVAPDESAADPSAASSSAGLSNHIEIARRTLWRLTRTDAYDRLRAVAVADAELTDEQFDRLARGEIASDLAAAEDAIEAIEAALDSTALED